MPTYTNISTYLFAPLTDLPPRRERLLAQCRGWSLKGTILLSPEGINLFVAGEPDRVEDLLAELRSWPGFASLTPKYSESDHQPFTRMLVKIKKEIIAFGVEGINPAERTSPKLPARELKRWLDEGRPVTLLDTRNDYEVKLGTFRGALPIGIDHFRDFPAAVDKLPEDMKRQPIVMFCTGGIRCEKAGPYMERVGFEQVYQLDGGIIKYFEECGGDHYDGECFVFDQRVGLDPSLAETDNAQCMACLTPLTVAEQSDPRYQPPVSCPYCFKTPAEQMADVIATRHDAIRRATTPLPGCEAYCNERPLQISGAYDRTTLIDFLDAVLGHHTRAYWETECAEGRLLNERREPVVATQPVRAGERYLHLLPGTIEPPVNADIELLYEDESLLVVNKPAPLPVHPCGRFNRNTLQQFLATVYAPQSPRPAHRLDALTTGVLVLARTRSSARLIQPQFERGEVEKVYLARVQGTPADDIFACDAPIADGPGIMGSRTVVESGGLASRTEFRVVKRFDDGTTLLEVRPITGRTNQIRIHLWHLGWPILGDPQYLPDGQLAQKPADDGEPLRLHAWRITFAHPRSNEPMTFTAPPPVWAESVEL